MNRYLIPTRARNLMTLHGLSERWKIEIIEATNKAGACRTAYYSPHPSLSSGTLYFSATAFALMSDEDCDNVILHEIAHALVPDEWDDNGRRIIHGDTWKAMARSIGCTAERTVDIPELRSMKKKNWRATCSKGHTFYRARLTKKTRDNSACPTCVTTYNIPYGKREALKWVAHTEAPVVRSTPIQRTQTKTRPPKPGELAWKDRFDQGMTSFDNDW